MLATPLQPNLCNPHPALTTPPPLLITTTASATAYAKAAEALATMTEDKADDAIRRRVADADATPKLCKAGPYT